VIRLIKSFIFENFKSFDKAKLDLEQLTIIIGSNAGGKTNAIEGIKLLSEISTGREFSVILDGSKNIDSDIRGGSKGCCKFNSNYFILGCIVDLDENFDLEYTIKIKVSDRVYVEEESLYKVSTDNLKTVVFNTKKAPKDSADIKVEYNNGKRGKNPDITCIRSSGVLSQLASKIPVDNDNNQDIINYISLIVDDLRNMLFLNPVPSNMRDYSRITDSELRPQADNISSVLYRLCKDEENKNKILDVIRNLPENEITDIDFIKTPIDDVMFKLKEKFGDKSDFIEAKRLSDGTIRCLAIIASLISEKNESIVIIEEVDNGIHPSRAKGLIDAISQLAKDRGIDVIITTHNPALLNSILGDNILGVSVCYRNTENGSSEFIPFIDINKYPKLLAQGGLGDLSVDDKIVKALKDSNNNSNNYTSWIDGEV
jgi:predicted ATPase